jgi:hypothetical protein
MTTRSTRFPYDVPRLQVRSSLGHIHNHQTASQYNQQNYDASYDMAFEDHAYFPDSLYGLPQEGVTNYRACMDRDLFFPSNEQSTEPQPAHQTQASRTNPTMPSFLLNSGRVASGGRPSLVPTSRLRA